MKALVVIPTFNEAESVVEVLDRVLAADPRVDVLVVDDGSPDGTAKLVAARSDGEPRIQLMERSGKQGLGAAYRAGFAWGLERGYDALVEMDADLSHPPDRLPALLDGLGSADLVIGSRYVPGGADGQLEPAAGGHLAGGQRLRAAGLADAGARQHGRVPGLPAGGAGGAAGGGGAVQRLLLPGRDGPSDLAGGVPGGGGADHLHRAGLRGVQDEQADRGRGAAAGRPVGPDRRAAAGQAAPSAERRRLGRLMAGHLDADLDLAGSGG